MQKEGFPVVVTPEMPASRDRESKKHVILTSWASVATALLLVVLVAGAFYVADLKIQLEEAKPNRDASTRQHKTKDFARTYDVDGQQTRQDYHLDEDEQTELIMKKNEDGNIEMIVAIDYKKKISVAYIPAAEECLLRSGVDSELADDLNILEDEKNSTVKISQEDNQRKTVYTSTGNRVTDMSFRPRHMKVYCEGKPTYWAQLADENDMVVRQKRRVYGVYRCYRCACGATTCYLVGILVTADYK